MKDITGKNWKITKEVIVKAKLIASKHPEKCIVNEKKILCKNKIANKLQPPEYSSESFIDSINTKL